MNLTQKKETVELAEALFSDLVHSENQERELSDPLLASLDEQADEERARILAQRSFTYAKAFVLTKASYTDEIEAEEPEPKQNFLRKNWKWLLLSSILSWYALYLIVTQ